MVSREEIGLVSNLCKGKWRESGNIGLVWHFITGITICETKLLFFVLYPGNKHSHLTLV